MRVAVFKNMLILPLQPLIGPGLSSTVAQIGVFLVWWRRSAHVTVHFTSYKLYLYERKAVPSSPG